MELNVRQRAVLFLLEALESGGGELTGVTGGQRFIELPPVMINRAGVVIASEVIRGMPELSRNPVSLHLRLPSLIHCPLLLVIPGANEEAVIDLRGQRPLCSAGSYQRKLRL